jgi:hypothetical protein
LVEALNGLPWEKEPDADERTGSLFRFLSAQIAKLVIALVVVVFGFAVSLVVERAWLAGLIWTVIGIPSLAEGTYRYAAYSTDGTDSWAYTLRYGFTVDPSPPSVPRVLQEEVALQLALRRIGEAAASRRLLISEGLNRHRPPT